MNNLEIRLTGTVEEINDFVTALTIAGYKFNRGREYYPQKSSAGRFAFYLKFVKLPPGATEPGPIAQSDDPADFDPIAGIDEDRENHYALYGEYPELC